MPKKIASPAGISEDIDLGRPESAPEQDDVMYSVAEKSNTRTGISKTANSGPERVLACLTCQQRKVKCDRKFPCANCIRHQVECEPALAPRRRRRRFPERDLLNRVRRYEDILRHHNIPFEALHPDHAAASSPATPAPTKWQDSIRCETSKDTADGSFSSKPVDLVNAIKHEQPYHAEDDNHGAGFDSDSGDDGLVGDWDRTYHDENHDEFLFGAGSSKANVELSTLHPEQIQIIRLWQIYLDNVNPLLRVTHSPTLQARILDAVGDLRAINPELEALIFSIYCVSVLSLTEDECLRLFSSPKTQLLTGYQFACRQALLKCKVLRTDNRDCLTALFLNLVSVAYDTHPRSMSSMLAVAIHIAQRMGIHMERTYATYSVLEAELCRRLWWSLVTFNHRICELSEYKTTSLTPAWDCKIPFNINDFEIRPETQTAPAAHEEPTEALFTLLRYRPADFLRHSAIHLSFASPFLNTTACPNNDDLTTLERLIEDRYGTLSDSVNPLYSMTIWTARASLARTRLLEYYSRLVSSEEGQQQPQQPGPQRDDESSVSHALRMLECDARLLTSPLTRGYTWFVRLHFPMLAYVHVLRYLRECPSGGESCRAWRVLGESYEAHAAEPKLADAIFVVCSRLVLQAWEARGAEMAKLQQEEVGPAMAVPRIVSDMRDKAAQLGSAAANPGAGSLGQHPPAPMPMSWGCQGIMGLQGLPDSQASGYYDLSPLDTYSMEMSQLWDTFD